jgi:predicted MFS family arabinose efflux permease
MKIHHKFLPWVICFFPALFYFFQYGLMALPSAITPELIRDFHINDAQLGMLTSFYFFSYVIMQIPVGLIYDRFNARFVLTCATALMGLGTLLFFFSHTFILAIISRIIMGFSASFAFVGAVYLVRQWFSDSMFPFMVGLTEASSGVGIIVLTAIFPILRHIQSWRMTTLELAGILLLVAVLMYIFTLDKSHHYTTETKKDSIWSDLLYVIKTKRLWLLSCFIFLMFAHFTVMASLWNIPFFKHHFHISTLGAISLNSSTEFGFIAGTLIIGFLARFIKIKPIILICSAILPFVVWLSLYSDISIAAEAVNLFIMGFITSSTILAFTLAKELTDPSKQGISSAFLNIFFGLSGIILMPLVGFLLQTYHHYYIAVSPVFITSVLVIIAGAAIFFTDFEKS